VALSNWSASAHGVTIFKVCFNRLTGESIAVRSSLAAQRGERTTLEANLEAVIARDPDLRAVVRATEGCTALPVITSNVSRSALGQQ